MGEGEGGGGQDEDLLHPKDEGFRNSADQYQHRRPHGGNTRCLPESEGLLCEGSLRGIEMAKKGGIVPPPLHPLPPWGGDIFGRICLINYGLISKHDFRGEVSRTVINVGLKKPSV